MGRELEFGVSIRSFTQLDPAQRSSRLSENSPTSLLNSALRNALVRSSWNRSLGLERESSTQLAASRDKSRTKIARRVFPETKLAK